MAGSGPPRALGIGSSLSPVNIQQALKDRLFNKRLKKAELNLAKAEKRLRKLKIAQDKQQIFRLSAIPAQKTTITGSESIRTGEQAVFWGTLTITGSLTVDGKLFIVREPYGT